MRIILFLLLSWYTIGNIQAQIKEPVKFKNELKMTSETEAEIVFTASIEKGWHVYSTGLGDDGPISATFNINASKQWVNCNLLEKKSASMIRCSR